MTVSVVSIVMDMAQISENHGEFSSKTVKPLSLRFASCQKQHFELGDHTQVHAYLVHKTFDIVITTLMWLLGLILLKESDDTNLMFAL